MRFLRAVKALQIVDKEGVATPADWPNNELIGDDVIMPPASNVKAANERKNKSKDYKCYDWWFCHKKVK